ncbi:hypothetical protein B296_00043797 [Ensete ventricosum]|uniref:Uncharacterized protein n=1 Tax=Ensete ventricosum TaxID=4639 RepID=A0A426XFY8_ENSVE|nr:hypothetical protein B296_00043797 [Ensete ventricosum]
MVFSCSSSSTAFVSRQTLHHELRCLSVFRQDPSSPTRMSSSSDSLPIAFRPVTQCRWCVGGSTTSSRRVAQASSSSIGSEPSKALQVLRDLAQMKEAHDYSSVVTSLQLEGL